MKKILTIQDFSCVGKCSLTVALPIISAFGIETCALPTALLSTHTQFENWTFCNLCPQIDPITTAWQNENIKFDGICTGYLGGIDLIETTKDIIDRFVKPDGIVMIDPAMGDNGTLYKGFDTDYVKASKTLCAKADVITPNVTEAAFMLGKEYKNEYDYDYLLSLCKELHQNGAGDVVITGVKRNETQVGVFCLLDGNEVYEYYTEREIKDFHGTGDIFSSVVYGGLNAGKTLKEAVSFACNFTKRCIAVTLTDPHHSFYAVNFEKCIGDITDFVKNEI
jgi:pyridoxine kinase